MASFTMAAPQQHRLLSLSAGLPAVILALSSSIAYLGIAAGSGVGSLVLTLTHGSITLLYLVGAAFAALALFNYWLSTRLSPVLSPEKRVVAPTEAPSVERLS
ncbi:MAG TPA: hypothetical protein VJQ26_09845 [Ktedonobacteraceae bacterium]|nr:hypothetical protein [Ktedonobacteraceae bacterium]